MTTVSRREGSPVDAADEVDHSGGERMENQKMREKRCR
jgi:hypothetical protein